MDYAVVLPKNLADELLMQLEETVEYFSGELTKVSFFLMNTFFFMLVRLVTLVNRRISCLLLHKRLIVYQSKAENIIFRLVQRIDCVIGILKKILVIIMIVSNLFIQLIIGHPLRGHNGNSIR